jgi:tetratricopeptide (TPR) repeat protein
MQQQAGEPMQVREMSVKARIQGLFAEVETTLSFYNPNPRQLEGELVFPLPDGAAVSGYALDVGGQLVDGVVVKKEKARVAFETETRRRVDPGLIEHVKGNVYRTRIYPLPPKAARTVRLRYVTELASDAKGDAALHLPLPRETIGTFNVRVEVVRGTVKPEIGGFGNLRFERMQEAWIAETTLRDTRPGDDILVALPKLPPTLAAVERDPASGDVYFTVNDVRQATAAPAAKRSARVAIAWDASGSRSGVTLAKELAFLEALCLKSRAAELALVVFRDRPEPQRTFASFAALRAALEAVVYDGGTDFAALAPALAQDAQWLLFTDGVETLAGEPAAFAGRQVTAVVSQTVADREWLRQACGDAGGCLIDLQRLEPGEALALALAPPRRVTGLQGTGIAAVQGVGAVASGRVCLTGRLTADAAEVRVTYSDGSLSEPVTLRKADAPEGRLLATAWAAGRVLRLSAQADKNEDELLELGHRFGLVSPATSLLVLESLDQYLRHEVEPPAMLAEMRRQWHDARARVSKEQTIAKRSKLDTVVALWQARVTWWERKVDVPKDYRWKGEVAAKRRGVFNYLSEAVAPASAAPAEAAREERSYSAMATSDREQGLAPAPASAAHPKSIGDPNGRSEEASIQVTAWNPGTPYLKRLKAAGKGEREKVYAEQRATFAASPAFYLDCAEFLLREGEAAFGIRVLTNLAELRIEDAALLRVLAWRLQQAGDLDRAVVILRRVARLRSEDPQSWRDLALVLAERGKASRSAKDLEEALGLFDKVVFGTWNRTAEIEVFALEERNALAAWIDRAEWAGVKRPEIPPLDERLMKNLDVDVRIVMAWDADATDVDLHVLEPTGEEAFFSHNRTGIGGLVSRDITDGYGPEEYLVRKAFKGAYAIKAKYYGSRQQTVIGPATLTATVFTDWGRVTEKRQTLTLRLDKPHDIVEIGRVTFGGALGAEPDVKPETTAETAVPRGAEAFEELRVGMKQAEVAAAVGQPAQKLSSERNEVWVYRRGERTWKVTFDKAAGGVLRVAESLPGNAEMIVVQ